MRQYPADVWRDRYCVVLLGGGLGARLDLDQPIRKRERHAVILATRPDGYRPTLLARSLSLLPSVACV